MLIGCGHTGAAVSALITGSKGMSRTRHTEPPRGPWAKEDRRHRKQWIRVNRARVRDALTHHDYDRASAPLRRTEGWLTW